MCKVTEPATPLVSFHAMKVAEAHALELVLEWVDTLGNFLSLLSRREFVIASRQEALSQKSSLASFALPQGTFQYDLKVVATNSTDEFSKTVKLHGFSEYYGVTSS